ncbi:hypothetical protein Bbelb_038870 [Branchiostoma belcheri]|nr:hypothetical protein Bbelb_038870 [Branchiostoma belcheri]
MSITRNRNPLTRMYEMCGEFIHQTEQAKYLGLTISQDLKWSAHINTVAKRANHRLHFLSRNLRFCPRKVRETAYFSLFRSTIEYGSASYRRKDIDTLEMVNRRAARFVTSYHRRSDVSATALLQDLRWPSHPVRRRDFRLIMMYKITNGLVAIPPTRLIPASTRTRANHSHKYKTLRPSCDPATYAYYARTIPEAGCHPDRSPDAAPLPICVVSCPGNLQIIDLELEHCLPQPQRLTVLSASTRLTCGLSHAALPPTGFLGLLNYWHASSRRTIDLTTFSILGRGHTAALQFLQPTFLSLLYFLFNWHAASCHPPHSLLCYRHAASSRLTAFCVTGPRDLAGRRTAFCAPGTRPLACRRTAF